jgi:hypothetical protein
MDEYVLSTFLFNETKTFLVIEPLNGTFYMLCHIALLLISKGQTENNVRLLPIFIFSVDKRANRRNQHRLLSRVYRYILLVGIQFLSKNREFSGF